MLIFIAFITASHWLFVEDDDTHHDAVGRLVDWFNCEIAFCYALHGISMMRDRLDELETARIDEFDRILSKYCRHISFLSAACVMYPRDPRLVSALSDLDDQIRSHLRAPYQLSLDEFLQEARGLISNFESLHEEQSGAWVCLSDSARVRSLLAIFAPGKDIVSRYRSLEIGPYSTAVVCRFVSDCVLEIAQMMRDGDERSRSSVAEFSDLLVEAVTTVGIKLFSDDSVMNALHADLTRFEAIAFPH